MTETTTDTEQFEDGCTNPAWHRDADALWYAARGLGEHELSGALEECGLDPLTARELPLVRLAIVAGINASRTVIREAGWLSEEPTRVLEETAVQSWAVQARETLVPWDADPLGVD
jgi:hypothetical protein